MSLAILLPVLRVVHIACGVFWAGTMIFVAWLLEPSLRASGPAGGQVMMQMIRRGYLQIIPAMAVLTVFSGGWLYWIVSGGLNAAWGHTPLGTALTIGAVAAIIALVLGLVKLRPAGLRLAELAGRVPNVESEAERTRILDEMEGIRRTLRQYGRGVAVLVSIAVVGMAIARYL